MAKLSILTLAWRNLMRNGRRTLATLLVIITGMTGILLYGGFDKSIQYNLETAFVRQTGHLQIQQKDYFQYGIGNPTAYSIAAYHAVEHALIHDAALKPLVRVSAASLTFGGIASYYPSGTSHTVIANGIDVGHYHQFQSWNPYALDSPPKRHPLQGTAADTAVVGGGVARILRLCHLAPADCRLSEAQISAAPASEQNDIPADIFALTDDEQHEKSRDNQVDLLTTTQQGAPNIARVHIGAIDNQPAREMDDIFIGMHLAHAQQLVYGRQDPKVTAIMVQLHDSASLTTAKARLQQLLLEKFPNLQLTVLDFSTLQPLYQRIIDMFGFLFGFVSLLIISIALFAIGNTMNMAVMERTVEIGTLRALGLHQIDIQALFMFEAALIVGIGAGGGIAVSFLLASLINHAGISWHPPGVLEPIALNIKLTGEYKLMIKASSWLFLTAILSAWAPAYRAARLDIAAALRQS